MEKRYIGDNIYLKGILIFFGMILSSIGVNALLSPAGLLGGGVTGLAIIANKVFSANVGVATFILNIPIYVLGFRYLNKKFCVMSMFNTVIFSIVIGITQYVKLPIDDILLQSIFGGVLTGVGYGLVFKAESTLGGTDILGAILKQNLNIPLKTTSLSINVCIVIIGSMLFGLKPAMYTLISMYVSASVMSVVKDIMDKKESVILISDKSSEIAEDIMKDMGRGVTFIEAEGAYTKEKKRIIYCIVSSNEIPKIKNIALKHDEKSFISVNTISDVKGKGFRDKKL